MWRRPISTHVSSGPRSRCRLTCASVPAKSRGFKQCIIAVLAALTGCARTTPTLSTQAFCQRTKPAPADWREVRLPASAATMRLPPSYVSEGPGWHGPDGARLTVTWRPHRRLVVHDSATISTPEAFAVGGPECSPEIAGRTVYLERTAEFPSSDSSLLWLTTATWEEMPGTDVLVTAGARDTGAQLEQLRAIWSLAR